MTAMIHTIIEKNTINGYFVGIFSASKMSDTEFYIADTDYNILFQEKAFTKSGDFSKEVNDKLSEYGIDIRNKKIRTESNIKKLKRNIERKIYLYDYSKK